MLWYRSTIYCFSCSTGWKYLRCSQDMCNASIFAKANSGTYCNLTKGFHHWSIYIIHHGESVHVWFSHLLATHWLWVVIRLWFNSEFTWTGWLGNKFWYPTSMVNRCTHLGEWVNTLKNTQNWEGTRFHFQFRWNINHIMGIYWINLSTSNILIENGIRILLKPNILHHLCIMLWKKEWDLNWLLNKNTQINQLCAKLSIFHFRCVFSHTSIFLMMGRIRLLLNGS